MKVDHENQGDPCALCGLPWYRHKRKTPREPNPNHKPKGDPCADCGRKASDHRPSKRQELPDVEYIGIDGEGQGRKEHRYVMLAAASANPEKKPWVIQAPPLRHLGTAECLRFICNLPAFRTKIFAYSFNYDLTKILADLDNEALYYLFRPDLRQRRGELAKLGPWPVKWTSERGEKFTLNLQGTKFTVRYRNQRAIVWDLFKFYGCKFTKALRDWKVGSDELVSRMELMKDKRAEFDKESREAVEAYCVEECRCLAELGQKLIAAHTKVGLKLKSFYGAGSSGGAMLASMNIEKQLVPALDEMREAVAAAFSGGRFENSVIGQIPGPLESKDISAAYPYHTTFLPCLLHGTWSHTERREDIELVDHACVRYGMHKNPGYEDWGPFPFRETSGSISYPIESGGGWIWRAEYLQGEKLFSHVFFKEAWLYHKNCNCQPFAAIPTYYRLRVQLGKEGPGIVIKLGVNSVYGKLAQSVGSARFNSWIWAGIITSGCRAQVLELLGLHKNRANLLMVATDGVVSREQIESPPPRDTGTWDTKKPLGGWETKVLKNGLFLARPGIYFPVNPTVEEIADIRGRGVGKGVILENWKAIVDSWEQKGAEETVQVANVSRFCGAKTCVSMSADGFNRSKYQDGVLPHYGQWISRKVEMDFNPLPKRARVMSDGVRLELRRFPLKQESMPYKKAVISKEARELMAHQNEMLEQPDGELPDYEFES